MSTQDAQALTAEIRLGDGSYIQLLRGEGEYLLALWDVDEDPGEDPPWILARIEETGEAHTESIPKRSGTHDGKPWRTT
jgi:hypothetical protein